jgi:NitT/TauT family transport system ATP-binding protein
VLLGDRVVVATTRPGRVKAVLPVPLPRPRRDHDVKGNPVFIRTREQIWDLLHTDVLEDLTSGPSEA